MPILDRVESDDGRFLNFHRIQLMKRLAILVFTVVMATGCGTVAKTSNEAATQFLEGRMGGRGVQIG
jgi:hypothetical protein